MPFLPSLLEYTPQDLESKLVLIKNNPIEFQTIQKAVDEKIHLHLDFVLPDFASERNVQPGNSPKIVFDLIHKYFHEQKVVCNSHFMGSPKDTSQVLEFFQSYNWNPNWEYILYVGQEFVANFNLFKNSNTSDCHLERSERSYLVGENTPNKTRLKIGAWLDLDQYDIKTKFDYQDYLLMTVFAGKSGQKLTPEVRSNCLKVIENNPDINFTIDGGWTVLDELSELNFEQKNKLNVVSYSSFWKEFEKTISGI
jgi:hypothetical protein